MAVKTAVLTCRFIPGTRTVTYLGAGFFGFSTLQFLYLTLISVLAWVSLAFAIGSSFSSYLRQHALIAIPALFVILFYCKKLVSLWSRPWERKAALHSWRRWLYFEFWPAWFFYLPVVPYYILLSVKYRTPFAPFYANPQILNGGLIGESKWDFLKHLMPGAPTTLKAIRIEPSTDAQIVLARLTEADIRYPFILKPDVVQRGFGVRIIKNQDDLERYLRAADFALIAQSLSPLPREAGLFYIRIPDQPDGFIFSITDKHFPMVVGDGRTRLGDLIMSDERARIIAPTDLSRFQERLDWIPNRGERVPLAECGNHCQGAIFTNGADLLTPVLSEEVNRIAKGIPDFFFGRFDVRYGSEEALKAGRFQIVEVNGAGSEATHIWDRTTPLLEAYKVLYRQWSHLFEVGSRVKASSPSVRFDFGHFMKEVFRVVFRKSDLSTSS